MTTTSTTAKVLRWTALLLLLGSLGAWGLSGANRGWTRTESTTMARDEITGLDYPVTTRAFQPGVDLIAVALGLSAVLGVVSWKLTRKAASHSA
jgi:hypothetical protein